MARPSAGKVILNSMVIIPRRLMPGNRVAVIAPSSPLKSEELQDGLDTIASLGLVPVLGPNVKNLKISSLHAATPENRAKEMMWAFSHPDISAVICVRGGYGSAEILPLLDFDVIRASKKLFIGKSDATSINSALLSKAGLASVSGRTPSIRRKNRDSDIESLERTLKLCMSHTNWGSTPFDINQQLPRTVSPGMAQGQVVGGNLDTLCCLLGTDYFPNVDGRILFLEDVHKSGVSVARKLIQLKLAGVLSSVAGVVIGEFSDVPTKKDDDEPLVDIENVIVEYFSRGVPCVYGYSFSHGEYTCPIPIGAQATLDANSRSVTFDFTLSR